MFANLTHATLRFIAFFNHLMILASSAIVTGLVSWFLHKYDYRGVNIVYQECIVCLSHPTYTRPYLQPGHTLTCRQLGHDYPGLLAHRCLLAPYRQIPRPPGSSQPHLLLPLAHLLHLLLSGLEQREVQLRPAWRGPLLPQEGH